MAEATMDYTTTKMGHDDEMNKCIVNYFASDAFKDMVSGVVTELYDAEGSTQQFADECEKISQSLEDNVVSKLDEMNELWAKMQQGVQELEDEIKKEQKREERSVLPPSLSPSRSVNRNAQATSSNINKPVQPAGPGWTFLNRQSGENRKVAQQQTRQLPVQQKEGVSSPLLKTHNGRILSDFLKVGMSLLALVEADKKQKGKDVDEWENAILLEIAKMPKGKDKYKVRFTNDGSIKQLAINQLACKQTADMFSPVDNRPIPMGSRVAASFRNQGVYSATIAEAADRTNRYRYLLFFDDGYAMYSHAKSVQLVFGPQHKVWLDIPVKATANYMKDFLSMKERPMLSCKEGQNLKVEFKGEWHKAQVYRVDSSLVEVLYLNDNTRELIYRGSMRLAPLWKNQEKRDSRPANRIARAHTGSRNKDQMNVEYVACIDLTQDSESSSSSSAAQKRWEAPWSGRPSSQQTSGSGRSVTKVPLSYSEMQGKVDVASTMLNRMNKLHQIPGPQTINTEYYCTAAQSKNTPADDYIDLDWTPTVAKTSPVYNPHVCNTKTCLPKSLNISYLKGQNPLLKPLLCGWTREIVRYGGDANNKDEQQTAHIYYRAPCGRTVRNMKDIDRYFRGTNLTYLHYEHFCFDPVVRIHSKILIKPADSRYFINDYSQGKEDIEISCVNEISDELPPEMPYTKNRIPGKDVRINTSPDFMVANICFALAFILIILF